MNTDWREQGQEAYLTGLKFWNKKYKKFSESWEHDHCEFCNAKFCESENESECENVGYATDDNYRWICETCFSDFKDKYNLIEMSEDQPE